MYLEYVVMSTKSTKKRIGQSNSSAEANTVVMCKVMVLVSCLGMATNSPTLRGSDNTSKVQAKTYFQFLHCIISPVRILFIVRLIFVGVILLNK